MLCIEEGDEHRLATSYNKQSRLKVLGIENNHAAIEGMPTLNDSDAKLITQSILAMRGVSQKKHKILHEQGDLKLQVRPMAYKGLQMLGCETCESTNMKIGQANQQCQTAQS